MKKMFAIGILAGLILSMGLNSADLTILVQQGNMKELLKQLNDGGDVNKSAGFYTSLLHVAAVARQTEIAELLIMRGADVNLTNDRGISPLMRAFINFKTHHGQILDSPLPTMRILIRNKADLNCKTYNGTTVLGQAAQVGDRDAYNLLLAHGAKSKTDNQ